MSDLDENKMFLNYIDLLIMNLANLDLDGSKNLYKTINDNIKKINQYMDTDNALYRKELSIRKEKVLDHILDLGFDIPEKNKNLNIYTPAVEGYRRWKNVELMKDKGLVGYTLCQKNGGNNYMFFCDKQIDYSFLSILPNMELIYTDGKYGNDDLYIDFLRENYKKMDILILHGMYIETIMYLNEYRKLRPDGKVFCGLDLNSNWTKSIRWENNKIKDFFNQCDVIATSCTFLRDKLNENIEFNSNCHFLSNAFLNDPENPVVVSSKEKENTIITVGRIGSGQKNNVELIIGFINALPKLKNWKLKLIGTVVPEFQKYLEDVIFKNRPELRKSIILTGPIYDKEKLYEEYRKAKIFALTSVLEGGTPNVYAEALVHGCKFITSDIDASQDITNFEEFGITYKLNDTEALTNAIIKLSKETSEEDFDIYIPKAVEYAKRYFDWDRNADKLRFLLLDD